MKVLVIVPTHHSPDRPFNADLFDEAMESLAGQTRQPDGIAITGNIGPGRITDDSLASRLNFELERSDCDAYVMLSDDDKLDPCFLQKTLELMESKGVDIVYTDCHVFGRRKCKAYAPGQWNERDIEQNTVPLVTSLCRKSAWRRAGGYSDVPMFDWHFWWKCFHTGATAYHLRQHLFWYREHENQPSFDKLLESRHFILDLHNRLRPQYTSTQ